MGSSFFSPSRALDPAGGVYQAAGSPGSGSTVGKSIMNDPVHNFLFGGKPQAIPATAGPYAGIAPTLAGAQGGYGLSNGNPIGTGGGGSSPQLQATFGNAQGNPGGNLSPAARPMLSGGMGGRY